MRAHYLKDPEFAALHDECLRLCYPMLEAEAVRQRLAAQQRLRDNLEPTGEMMLEFERVMKLLARYDRLESGMPACHRPAHSRVSTFEEAILALDRKLRALGLRRGIVPPEGEGEEGEEQG